MDEEKTEKLVLKNKLLESDNNLLISKDFRKFLLTELNKRNKTLNQKYKNRYYQDCEIDKILKG